MGRRVEADRSLSFASLLNPLIKMVTLCDFLVLGDLNCDRTLVLILDRINVDSLLGGIEATNKTHVTEHNRLFENCQCWPK